MTQFNKQKAEKLLLTNFQKASTDIPAYKDFLKKNKVNPKKINTVKDYKTYVPFVTKENYLRVYSLKDLVWDGKMFGGNILSLSSGSTGEPYVWLRDQAQREESQKIYFKMYKEIFGCDQRATLLVVCFSMGTWIAGSYTSIGAMLAGEKGLPINTINPALDIEDAVKIIQKQSPDYQQIIIAGYPPLVKDIIDVALDMGVNLKRLNVKYTLAGEQISEELRDYILQKGTAYKSRDSVINIYGTADAGILSHETPLSIKLREELYQSGGYKKIFGQQVLPSFHQFDPAIKYLEQDGEDIVVNSYSGIPLFRYKIKDKGGVIDNPESLSKDSFKRNAYSNFPAVYIHGRDDFTVSLYAVLIYPENIKDTLIAYLSSLTTGRFIMTVDVDKRQDQHFKLTIELQKTPITDKNKKLVSERIVTELIKKNREYAKLYEYMGKKVLPQFKFATKNEGIFSNRAKDNKQKWVA